MENIKGQGFIPVLLVILGSIVLVGAVVINTPDENLLDLNETINISDKEILSDSKIIIENLSTINEVLTENETISINETQEQGTDEIITTENTTQDEIIEIPKTKNLSEIVEENKEKLNEQTKEFLKTISDKKEKRDFIVKFKNSIEESKLNKVDLENQIQKFDLVKINGKIENIEDLIEDDEIEFIELDQDTEILGDIIPLNVKKTKADAVWNLTNGSGVKVAVLDTGITQHDDLSIAGGTNIVGSDYYDTNGHGTAVAGVIASTFNGDGLVGVSPSVGLYSVRIMQGPSGSLSDAISGIQWAIDNNMSIISMSFGFDSYSQIFKDVLDEAYANGILLIAASGNNGDNNILYPAAYSSVIAIGAVDSNDNLASFSSYGFEQELVASGVDINSTSLNDGYSVSSGTSMAVPHVAGVAALIKSYNNSLTNEEIRAKLRNDALDLGDSGKDDYFGYGLVQVNLTSYNFAITNDSYFYEIFNISDYGLPNISYHFWISGTGTIEDVEFEEGYYLINKTFNNGFKSSNNFHVEENGSLFLLFDFLNLTDDYTVACPNGVDCKHDGIVFRNYNLNMKLFDDNHVIKAECFDFADDGLYEDCYGTQPNMDLCRANVSELFYDACTDADPVDPICESEGSIGTHSVPTSVSKASEIDSVNCYLHLSAYHSTSPDSRFYYVCDHRQYVCTSSAQYVDRCFYNVPSGSVNIGTINCNSGETCDFSQDESNADFGTSGTSIPSSPCKPPCSGNIRAYIDNSKGIVDNYSIYLNAINKGSTSNGFKQISSVSCNINHNVTVYCYNNNTKPCETKQTSIDFNGDNDSLVFNCNICSDDRNLGIQIGGIDYKQISGNNYLFNITIFNENAGGSFNIMIKTQDKETGLISSEKLQTESISSTETTYNAIVNNVNTNNANFLHIYIDVNNSIKEENENYNYVIMPFIKIKLKATLEVKTGNTKADEAIENYLKLFIDRQPGNSSTQYLNILVGKNSSTFSVVNKETKRVPDEFYFNTKSIIVNNVPIGNMPYNGVVAFLSNINFGKTYIVAYGKGIEGDVAAAKTMIAQQNLLFDYRLPDRRIILDNYDLTGLKVMDLMHNPENSPYFNKKSAEFGQVIEDILNDNNFEIAIKTVRTRNDNTTLRIKNANSDLSETFRDVVVKNAQPVVMAQGLHSDLFKWENFANEIAQNGRDAWLIEMYGGPTTECDICPQYDIDDLKNYYWPALIGGVQTYSNRNNLSYIGYDLGCTVALESLENYSNGFNGAGYYFDEEIGQYISMDLASNPIGSFIGVGCIGNFTKFVGTDKFGDPIGYYAPWTLFFNQSFEHERSNFGTHPTGFGVRFQMMKFIVENVGPNVGQIVNGYISLSFPTLDRTSVGVYDSLFEWINSPNGVQIGKDVPLQNVLFIQSNFSKDESPTIQTLKKVGKKLVYIEVPAPLRQGTDEFLSTNDQKGICKNVVSSNKKYVQFEGIPHFDQMVKKPDPFEIFDILQGFDEVDFLHRGMDENKKVKNLIMEFIDNGVVNPSKVYRILSC